MIDAYARRIVGWKVSTSATAGFVLDALEQAIHARRPGPEIKKIDRELDTLLNLILKGGAAERLNEKMVGLERRLKELKAFLQEAEIT